MHRVASRHVASRQMHEHLGEFHHAVDILTASGISGGGKNHFGLMLQRHYPRLQMIRSITTRDIRGLGQDQEYRQVSRPEFIKMRDRGEFQWWVELFGEFYGTLKCDIRNALCRNFPSMMHLVHERVQDLQDVVREVRRRQGVFSFLIICDNEDILRKRIISRQPDIALKKLDERLQGLHDKQESWRKSGIYHAVIENNGDRPDRDLFLEMVDHLALPIPKPRKF